jgi:hypothetical protein
LPKSDEETRKARRNWRSATERVSKLWYVLDYAKARWNIACRHGDTPTCGNWRKFCSYLEGRLEQLSKLDSLAWDQNFEHPAPSRDTKDDMLEVDPLNGDMRDRKLQFLEHPHSWAEVASATSMSAELDSYSEAKCYTPESTWRSVPVNNDVSSEAEEEEEVQAAPKEVWVVQTPDGFFTFDTQGEALPFATQEVEEGHPRATIYKATVVAVVEAIVHRTIQVIPK